MATNLSGYVAIITGAGSGIGQAVAVELTRAGCSVYLIGRTLQKLENTRALIEDANPHVKVSVNAFDVRENDLLAAAVQDCVDTHGSLSIVVNNAGMGCLTEMSLDKWDETIDINLKAAMRLSHHAMPHLEAAAAQAKKKPIVVNMASISGRNAYGQLVPYCASKHGLVGYSNSLFAAVAKKGIRVTCVLPGWVDTPMIHGLPSYDPDHCITPEQIAHTVLFAATFPGNACPTEITVVPQFE